MGHGGRSNQNTTLAFFGGVVQAKARHNRSTASAGLGRAQHLFSCCVVGKFSFHLLTWLCLGMGRKVAGLFIRCICAALGSYLTGYVTVSMISGLVELA